MIYRFKITFDASKTFFRIYELRGENTLYDFHEHIVNDLNYAPDQIVFFHVKDKTGKALKKYGLFDFGHGSMDEITIDALIARGEKALFYVFDTHSNRALRLTFVETDDELPRKSYPRTVDEKDDAPPQFVDKNLHSPTDLQMDEDLRMDEE
ncbi:MAG: plasmid pRiA4b ORF-3 family protein [Prevotellaceae bacterium]|jgi:L-ribulose-5-phosphate 3-epimerase UlaE|nr:plasmid pRiA4b ORF-3 family protein [Prevotellaceae bacterium]